jgi:hypothetical protein
MGDEELIELVRRYEAIYNIKCKEYRDATLRNAAWEEIATVHGKTGKYMLDYFSYNMKGHENKLF